MTTTSTRTLDTVLPRRGMHWVGDGFPVRTAFSYAEQGEALSPFLLLDHAGPADFTPSAHRRGVGEHPHRGFETVTIVYAGEVEHRDSAGGGGVIGPGDVQWMTAGSGLVHEERHGAGFAARGGRFEMVQLWVNLPARHKMTAARYQGIAAERIPTIALGDGADLRLIAGRFAGTDGPAQTWSPILLADLRMSAGSQVDLPLPPGHTAALLVRAGTARLPGGGSIPAGRVGVTARDGHLLRIAADGTVEALLLAGQPLGEPVVGHGPFVMNDEAGIRQALTDYASGRMGRLGDR